MPFYEFTSDNPESPYHTNPKSVFWTIKEFEEKKDNMICEITGEKLRMKGTEKVFILMYRRNKVSARKRSVC